MSFIKTIIKAVLGTIAVVVTLIVMIAMAWPSGEEVQSSVDDLYTQQAVDYEEQYQMLQKEGDPVELCVRAGFVAEAYLQARDNDNFGKWHAIEEADCAAAGIVSY